MRSNILPLLKWNDSKKSIGIQNFNTRGHPPHVIKEKQPE